MPIPFACPHCGHQTLVEDKYAGESGDCVKCGKRITVPLATSQGAVVPHEKIDVTGGSAAGVVISCAAVLAVVALITFFSLGFAWFWWQLGF